MPFTGASISNGCSRATRGSLSHGWKPESGFLASRWDHYCELMILYLLAIGSPTHAIPRGVVDGVAPADGHVSVVHLYRWTATALRSSVRARVGGFPRTSRARGAAHRLVAELESWRRARTRRSCCSLAAEFPGYTENVWGVTASDSRKGYVAWGGPPRDPAIDGTVVPCAVTGSLMLTPDITLPAVREMQSPFRRSHLRPLRVRRCVSSQRRLGQSRCHRHRPRHHGAQCREPEDRTHLGVVHAQSGSHHRVGSGWIDAPSAPSTLILRRIRTATFATTYPSINQTVLIPDRTRDYTPKRTIRNLLP